MPDVEGRCLSTGSPILNPESATRERKVVDVANLIDIWSVGRIHFQHGVD